MKEHPVIFNSEMVRAILDCRKTQTRRVINPQPTLSERTGFNWKGAAYGIGSTYRDTVRNFANCFKTCPFGQVGDRLWVRETFAVLGNEDGCPIDWNGNLIKGDEKQAARIYKASCWQEPGNYGLWSIPDRETQYEGTWRPSIHMPRWASRITLEITGVRVERLQDISEADAIAEGGTKHFNIDWFGPLWASIYGVDSWDANPWVWVIEFRLVGGSDASQDASK